MEAPDSIYLFRNPIGVILDSWYLNSNAPFEKIEYTRKDAFIEKACEWLKKNRKNYSSNALGEEYLIDDFKKAMKGE